MPPVPSSDLTWSVAQRTVHEQRALFAVLSDAPRAASSLARGIERDCSLLWDSHFSGATMQVQAIETAIKEIEAVQYSTISRCGEKEKENTVLQDVLRLSQNKQTQLTKYNQAVSKISTDWQRVLTSNLHKNIHTILLEAKRLKEREYRIRDFFGTSPGLWDLEEGVWQKINFDGIESAAGLLKNFPVLLDLARRLGRSWGDLECREMESRSASDCCLEALGSSELVGYQFDNDLELVISHEIALLSDQLCADLFLLRYAESKLTCRQYLNRKQLSLPDGKIIQSSVGKNTKDAQGPVIICLDTSGSMCGAPEAIAKALSLAIVQTIHASGRGAWLISFSDHIRSFDLANPQKDLQAFAEFLTAGFHGGTDLRPALAEALRLLKEELWTRADILIISDFKVPKIILKKMDAVHQIRHASSSRLHSLQIGPEPLRDDLQLFDTHWHFVTSKAGNLLGLDESQFKENI
jgi:uncharacterized protein with von Willebrand factor type A (vWA) domain